MTGSITTNTICQAFGIDGLWFCEINNKIYQVVYTVVYNTKGDIIWEGHPMNMPDFNEPVYIFATEYINEAIGI